MVAIGIPERVIRIEITTRTVAWLALVLFVYWLIEAIRAHQAERSHRIWRENFEEESRRAIKRLAAEGQAEWEATRSTSNADLHEALDELTEILKKRGES